MLRKNMIPRHIGIKTLKNPRLPALEKHMIEIPLQNIPFDPLLRSGRPRNILINNFNATGGNTSIILQDWDGQTLKLPEQSEKDPRTSHVMVVSGASPRSYKSNLVRLASFLDAHKKIETSHLAYTLTSRKLHHAYRYACSVSSLNDLRSQLKDEISMAGIPTPTKTAPNAIFVFSGQGSTRLGMAHALFWSSKTFRDNLLALEDLCRCLDLPSFIGIISGGIEKGQNPRPVEMQLALVALEICLAKLWLTWGVRPMLVIGHSLGEYAALCIAGVLTESDALFLVGKRALLLEERCVIGTYTMLSVSASSATVLGILEDTGSVSCEISCYNAPESVVVSGANQEIQSLQRALRSKQIKTANLELPYAFHSSQMDAIYDSYKLVCESVTFGSPQVAVASSLLGSIVTEEGTFNADYLCSQTRQPVKFSAAVVSCEAIANPDQTSVWLEMGPGSSCHFMIKAALGEKANLFLPSLSTKEDDWKVLSRSVALAYKSGFNISWTSYHKEYTNALTLLETPAYSFDSENHWIQYEGDWSIRKSSYAPQAAMIKQPERLTLTLHRLVQTQTQGSTNIWRFETDFSEPELLEVTKGHVVHESYLCPSSIYADMVTNAAKHIRTLGSQKYRGDDDAVEVASMEVSKPLIIRPEAFSQVVHVVVQGKTSTPDSLTVTIQTEKNNIITEHACCIAHFGSEPEWTAAWQPKSYLYLDRINQLHDLAAHGKADRIRRNLIYKIFSSFVDYSKPYQGMDEVVMEDSNMEGSARVTLALLEGGQRSHPCWIDALCHITGFLLHASTTRPTDVRYISHGWKAMRLSSRLRGGQSFRNHVRMQQTDSRGTMVGDVHVFEGGCIVAAIEGIKFTPIQSSVLASLINPTQRSQRSFEIARPIKRAEESSVENPNKPAKSADISGITDSFHDVLRVIASEIGVSVQDLGNDARFDDLGVDSLLTIAIVTKLQEDLHYEVPPTLFFTCTTVAELRVYFQTNHADKFGSDLSGSTNPRDQHRIDKSGGDLTTEEEGSSLLLSENEAGTDIGAQHMDESNHATSAGSPINVVENIPRPTAIHLQNPPNPDCPRLILFPDGSGSAASYIDLPPIRHDTYAVTAFNSPLHDLDLNCLPSLEEVACKYVAEILIIQPSGPYHLAGWSIGGTYAYEVAKQLISLNKTVTHLILIDAPCPQTMAPLPNETVDILEAADVFSPIHPRTSQDPQARFRQREQMHKHFISSTKLLTHYRPIPMVRNRKPLSCHVIWARAGLAEEGQRPGILDSVDVSLLNDAQSWLLLARGEIGSGGWERLVPDVESQTVEGNHFSVMREPLVCFTLSTEAEVRLTISKVKGLGEAIERALS